MNRMHANLIGLTALAGILGLLEPSFAQFPAVQVPGVSLGFRNDTKAAIIVQGASKVNNQFRRGQPIVVAPGQTGFDNHVPMGVRFITIYDATQPSRILLANFPVSVQGKASYSVKTGPGGVMLTLIPGP